MSERVRTPHPKFKGHETMKLFVSTLKIKIFFFLLHLTSPLPLIFSLALPKKSANRTRERSAQQPPPLLLLEEAFVSVVVVVVAVAENFAFADSVVDVGNLLFGILHHPCEAFHRIDRLCAFVARIASSDYDTEHRVPCRIPSSCSFAPSVPGNS